MRGAFGASSAREEELIMLAPSREAPSFYRQRAAGSRSGGATYEGVFRSFLGACFLEEARTSCRCSAARTASDLWLTR
jgi:hypothetical protein